MDANRYLHTLPTSYASFTFSEPFALVSFSAIVFPPDAPVMNTYNACGYFDCPDAFGVVPFGALGIPYHARLARSGSIVTFRFYQLPSGMPDGTLFTVLTDSPVPPIMLPR